MKWLGLALAVGVAAAGCDCSSDAPVTRCESSADCPDGLRCIDGRCLAATDSGARDSGSGVDAGEVCRDFDSDGHSAVGSCPGADDCDDDDAEVHPGAGEVCGNG